MAQVCLKSEQCRATFHLHFPFASSNRLSFVQGSSDPLAGLHTGSLFSESKWYRWYHYTDIIVPLYNIMILQKPSENFWKQKNIFQPMRAFVVQLWTYQLLNLAAKYSDLASEVATPDPQTVANLRWKELFFRACFTSKHSPPSVNAVNPGRPHDPGVAKQSATVHQHQTAIVVEQRALLLKIQNAENAWKCWNAWLLPKKLHGRLAACCWRRAALCCANVDVTALRHLSTCETKVRRALESCSMLNNSVSGMFQRPMHTT